MPGARALAPVVRQFARFVLVGATNTALTLATYVSLRAAGMPYLLAGAAGFAVGAVNGYVLNRRWTFAAADSSAARIRYLAVQLGGLAASTLSLWALVRGVGLGRVPGELLAVPAVTILMFAANRSWTFTRTAPPPASVRVASWSSG
jgi:putative flippase GtrA